ncbi:MAG: dTMP kinase [Holosporaceae bacterium]|jgi:dTMP kinase|nr:dTMP kinase [Holosporaceae bacterium]
MPSNFRGKFITFEGGEGVGKSTQVKLLAEKLSYIGQKVHVTREPGGGEVGEKIRDLLKKTKEIDPICEILLLFAARRDHFVKLIFPLLNDGYFVICDRFYDSSLVYQGLLKKVSVEDIMKLKQMTIGDFEPDLTIILDLDTDISIRRVKSRHILDDEYDEMGHQQYQMIRSGFQKISEIFQFRTVLINAEGSEKKIFSKIWKIFQKKYGELTNN